MKWKANCVPSINRNKCQCQHRHRNGNRLFWGWRTGTKKKSTRNSVAERWINKNIYIFGRCRKTAEINNDNLMKLWSHPSITKWIDCQVVNYMSKWHQNTKSKHLKIKWKKGRTHTQNFSRHSNVSPITGDLKPCEWNWHLEKVARTQKLCGTWCSVRNSSTKDRIRRKWCLCLYTRNIISLLILKSTPSLIITFIHWVANGFWTNTIVNFF